MMRRSGSRRREGVETSHGFAWLWSSAQAIDLLFQGWQGQTIAVNQRRIVAAQILRMAARS